MNKTCKALHQVLQLILLAMMVQLSFLGKPLGKHIFFLQYVNYKITLLKKIFQKQAWPMVQWARALSAHAQDPALVPSTHLVAYNPKFSSFRDTRHACSADTHRLAEWIEINTNGSLKQRFKMEFQATSDFILRENQSIQRIHNSILINKKLLTNAAEKLYGERTCLARVMCSTLSIGEKKVAHQESTSMDHCFKIVYSKCAVKFIKLFYHLTK